MEVMLLPDHTTQITLGLDILTNTEIARPLLEEWVLRRKVLVFNVNSSPFLGSRMWDKQTETAGDMDQRTLFAFVFPPFPPGNGAGAVFFPFGGCHREKIRQYIAIQSFDTDTFVENVGGSFLNSNEISEYTHPNFNIN